MAVNDKTNLMIYRAECYACGCTFTAIDTKEDGQPPLLCLNPHCASDNVVPCGIIKPENVKRIIPNYKTQTT